jgi:hypothetical protein
MSHNIIRTGKFFFVQLIVCNLIPLQETGAQYSSYEASVTDNIPLRDIPSASGIEMHGNNFYVAGDDSPYLFQLNSEFQTTGTIKIYSEKKLQDGRIPKKYKPDFESIAIAPWGKDNDLLIFGSGSASKTRNSMIRIDFDEDKYEVKSYSLKKFYSYLAEKFDEHGNLNIEGAAFWNKHLILLNRTDNTLFKIDYDDFVNYIKKKDKDKPGIKAIKYELPAFNGITARFSGACLLPDENMLVFTASVENTPNWMNDGKILGSYIGILDLDQTENTKPVCVLIEQNGNPFPYKVESLFVSEKNENSIKLIGVTDNDDGGSQIIALTFYRVNH